MILEEIKEKLEEIGPVVYYGKAGKLKEGDLWNYVVFTRDRFSLSENKTSGSLYINVAVVRENYVEEDMEWKLIKLLQDIPGLRPASDAEYLYTTKPDTQNVIEILSMDFVIAKRRC